MGQAFLTATWQLIQESALFLLGGFLAAGMIKSFLPMEAVARHLSGKGLGPVVKAALFGIPLPLCSCGVLPAAIALRKQGATKGATTAFLISTPESGVDSIAVTYALMDPVMTVFRPVAAFFTAFFAGALELLYGNNNENAETAPEACCEDCESPTPVSIGARLKAGLAYAFGELMDEMAKWLVLGLAIAGLISAILPSSFFTAFSDNEFVSMSVMLIVGIPLYVCASASTPIAAALMLKGLSPGAALVFLLSGPATNAASLVVLAKMLGKRSTAIYLAAIAASSMAMGYLLNRVYPALGIEAEVLAGAQAAGLPVWLENGAAILLCGLLARSLFKGWRVRRVRRANGAHLH